MNINHDDKKQTVFREDVDYGTEAVVEEESVIEDETSTGLQPNLAALLAYLFGFISGIIILLIEKENEYVRFHAVQSIIVFAGLFVVGFVLSAIPLLGWFIGLLISPVGIIIWIFLMIKAYKNDWYKFPIAGEMAMNQIKKK